MNGSPIRFNNAKKVWIVVRLTPGGHSKQTILAKVYICGLQKN